MVCAYNNHQASDDPLLSGLSSLANVGELCKGCRDKIVADLARRPGTTSSPPTDIGGFLNDYIKLHVVLSSTNIFSTKIENFGNLIVDGPKRRGLSYHLKRFETKCLFPDIEVIPTGVLSVKDFYDMIARGVMWKDVGAGLNHGLYAHRLQWHVVLAVITNDFTMAKAPGWDHGGYDIFVSMGVEGRDLNIWGKLFDASATNCFRAPEYVEQNIGHQNIKERIESKYQKYHKIFREIRIHVDRVRAPRATAIVNSPENTALKFANKGHAAPGYKHLGAEEKRIDFEITNALWATYYFAQRDIRAAMPSDEESASEYRQFAGRHKIYAGDRSKKFAPDKVVVEHNTVRLSSQMMPSPARVSKLREDSGISLAEN